MSYTLTIDPRRPRDPKWSTLSDAAYRFADALLLWCAEFETDFLPFAITRQYAGSAARAKRLIRELVYDCANAAGMAQGILEEAGGGFRLTAFDGYSPVRQPDDDTVPLGQSSPPNYSPARFAQVVDLSEKRREAGRKGGLTSAERRRIVHGSAQPKQSRPPPEANLRSKPEANLRSKPEATSKQTVEANLEANPKQNPDLSGQTLSGSAFSGSGSHPEVVEPKDLSGFHAGEGQRQRQDEFEAKAEAKPEDVLLPSVQRCLAGIGHELEALAQWCAEHPERADEARPHTWAEVRQVALALGNALGQPASLGAYSKDPGTRGIVSCFAAGLTLEELRRVAVIAKAGRDPWWFERRRGVSSLGPESARRTLGLGDHVDRDHRKRVEDEAKSGVYGPGAQRMAEEGRIDELMAAHARWLAKRRESPTARTGTHES